MTPKEKAKELCEKMLGDNCNYINKNIEIDKLIAKQCALFCVDEILSTLNRCIHQEDWIYEEEYYWQEVKQEIEKL